MFWLPAGTQLQTSTATSIGLPWCTCTLQCWSSVKRVGTATCRHPAMFRVSLLESTGMWAPAPAERRCHSSSARGQPVEAESLPIACSKSRPTRRGSTPLSLSMGHCKEGSTEGLSPQETLNSGPVPGLRVG